MDATVAIETHGWSPHHLRHRALILGACLVGALFARSAASASPKAAQGAPACRHIASATTTEYLTGVACPPAGFTTAMGYVPVLELTPAGWRFTRPADTHGGCSGPLSDGGPFWDFGAQCRAHDYGYDLVRFGAGSRAEADAQLYDDMKATCAEQSAVGRPACKTMADSAHAVLWFGDVSPGFEPAGVS